MYLARPGGAGNAGAGKMARATYVQSNTREAERRMPCWISMAVNVVPNQEALSKGLPAEWWLSTE